MKQESLKPERCSNSVWKIRADSNIYFLNLDEKIIIDTGNRDYREHVREGLAKLVNINNIQKVIFTHLHYDHIGNFDLFPNARFFASRQEIMDFKKNPIGTILDPGLVKIFKVELNPINSFDGFKIINSPGHTKGAICLYYEKEGVLFSGDTLFFQDQTGRTDLPTSEPEKMNSSINAVKKLGYKVLCPGHDY